MVAETPTPDRRLMFREGYFLLSWMGFNVSGHLFRNRTRIRRPQFSFTPALDDFDD